jgi:4,5-DOPA dioxygenase extradiol
MDSTPVAAEGQPSRHRRARNSARAPATFIGFPSPLLLKDEGYSTALRRFGIRLRQPKGIVVASARWHTVRPLRVTGSIRPPLLHDYGDYPAWLERVSYRCAGAPALASDVAALLNSTGQPAVLDPKQGLDFATWMPMSLMYSSGKVPVVQVSLPAGGSPTEMMAVGKALAPLRQAGIMLVGTGATVCNPHRVSPSPADAGVETWALAFDEWVSERLAALDLESLIEYRRRAPHAHLSAPTADFLDPLFFVLGASLTGDRVVTIFEGFHAGSLSLRTCLLAGRRREDLRLPDELVG